MRIFLKSCAFDPSTQHLCTLPKRTMDYLITEKTWLVCFYRSQTLNKIPPEKATALLRIPFTWKTRFHIWPLDYDRYLGDLLEIDWQVLIVRIAWNLPTINESITYYAFRWLIRIKSIPARFGPWFANPWGRTICGITKGRPAARSVGKYARFDNHRTFSLVDDQAILVTFKHLEISKWV